MRGLIIFAFCLSLAAISMAEMTLEQVLVDKILRDYDLNPEYVSISLHRSGLSHKDIVGCDVKAYPLTQSRPKGRFPMRVELHRDGAIIDRASVSLDVRLSADLLTPIRNIKRREVLTPALFTVKRFDVTTLTKEVLSDPMHLNGCRAKQNLTADKYVELARIEKIPDVESGNPVTIVGNNDLFEIRTKGIALQNGYVGEMIRVKNSDSRRILSGKVIRAGIVEIAL